MSKQLLRLVLVTALASILSACGAPQPPMPFGERIPVNEQHITGDPNRWDNGTSELFESNQTQDRE